MTDLLWPTSLGTLVLQLTRALRPPALPADHEEVCTVPAPQLAIDSHEIPHTIWYRGDRRQALEAATDGTLLEHIDAPPARPPGREEVVDEHQRTLEAARALAAHWEVHHGPLRRAR
jgi:hypothetical protein